MSTDLRQRLLLFCSHKLTEEVYEEYLFACRDGVPFRKRNLDLCRERQERLEQEAQIEERTKRRQWRNKFDLYVKGSTEGGRPTEHLKIMSLQSILDSF